jgi:hypothetical protein
MVIEKDLVAKDRADTQFGSDHLGVEEQAAGRDFPARVVR